MALEEASGRRCSAEETNSLTDRNSNGTPVGMPWEDYYYLKNVSHETSRLKNARGISLFVQSWFPVERDPKAILFMCHGYGNDSSWDFQVTAIEFAVHGFAVFAFDQEGHGKSEGLRCGVRKFGYLVDSFILYIVSVTEQSRWKNLPVFLYGESLGGAVVLQTIKKKPEIAKGVVLSAPMIKLAPKLRPHWLLEFILSLLAYIIPDAAIVPTKPDVANGFRDPEKLKIAAANPNRYSGHPRLGFSLEIIQVTTEISSHMEDVDFPFLVIHGECDLTTDASFSRELFERARSKDKTLRLYSKGWHQLLSGEPPEESKIVWQDVLTWLDERVGKP